MARVRTTDHVLAMIDKAATAAKETAK